MVKERNTMTTVKQLGKGGFSTVYRPSKTQQGERPYVIKRPNPQATQKERRKTNFKYNRQKRILDYLRKKFPTKSNLFNQIYEVRQNQVIMKDLGDMDLSTLVYDHFDQITPNVNHLFTQLKNGLLTMLQAGIVHRDIKLANIMVEQKNGHFYICFIDFADSLTRKEIEKKLRSFHAAGTVNFMSPELLHRVFGPKRDLRKGDWEEYVANDLWALGVVLYILIYGQYPLPAFKKRHPSIENFFPSPLQFYMGMKDRPDIYDSIFSTHDLPENKKRLVPDVKALLSLNPIDRLRWLKALVQKKQRQKNLQTLSAAASSVQEPVTKKRKTSPQSSSGHSKAIQKETSGLALLLKAIRQQQKTNAIEKK